MKDSGSRVSRMVMVSGKALTVTLTLANGRRTNHTVTASMFGTVVTGMRASGKHAFDMDKDRITLRTETATWVSMFGARPKVTEFTPGVMDTAIVDSFMMARRMDKDIGGRAMMMKAATNTPVNTKTT